MSTPRSLKVRPVLVATLVCGVAGISALNCGFSNGGGGAAGTTGSGAGTTGAAGNGTGGTVNSTGGTTGTAGNGTGGTVTPTGGSTGAAGNGTGGTITPTGGTTGTAGNGTGGTVTPTGGSTGMPTSFKNYEATGSFNAPLAIAQKPGSLTYTKVVIHSQFLAESCSIADYNGDNVPDVSSGRIWYEGPDFTKQHAFRSGHGALPRNGDGPEIDTGVSDDWADFPWDVNGDTWPDIINVAQCNVDEIGKTNPKIGTVQPHGTAYWYENPKTGPGQVGDSMWTPHLMHSDIVLEQHGFVDMDKDGFPEIYGACKTCTPPTTKGYYSRNATNPNMGWTFHSVTIAYTFPFGGLGWMHGEGAGDVNGDGLPDLLERGGAWLQQPGGLWNATKCTGKNTPAGCGWIAEKSAGGTLIPSGGFYDSIADGQGNKGASNMFAVDMDKDGLPDVVAADWAHGVGLFWYKQGADGKFTKYQFMGDSLKDKAADVTKWGAGFTEPHSLEVYDMDGDGRLDVVAGKMRFAHPHGYGDPDSDSAPYIYVFKNIAATDPNSGGPITLKPMLVDGAEGQTAGSVAAGMGVGRHMSIGHVNTDGIMDICVGTKVGLAVFLGKP
jgi:FG-GAP-like repeat